MKCLLKCAFSIALLVSAGGVNVHAAISIRGDGFINYDGTGDVIVQGSFPVVIERYRSNCTPPIIPGFIFICKEPLDMSLLGNDILRAEHVRIGASLHTLRSPLVLRFGPILVEEEDLVSVTGTVGWRLNYQTTQALQALIDQHGPGSIFMSIALQDGAVGVASSVRAVVMDIKPGDVPNTLNPRSHGVVPIAIVTTEQFDATSIDMTSLRFGVTGQETAALRAVLDDVDGDGDTDLLAFFRSRDPDLGCEDQFTYISGVTVTGESIAGIDSVVMVGCH